MHLYYCVVIILSPESNGFLLSYIAIALSWMLDIYRSIRTTYLYIVELALTLKRFYKF